MIARKQQKFSLNSSEANELNLPNDDDSSFFNQHRNKTAVEAANSILEELGINESLENSSANSKAGTIGEKTDKNIYKTKKHQDQKNFLLKDFDNSKTESKKYPSRLKDDGKKSVAENKGIKKPDDQSFEKSGFHENLILFVIFFKIRVVNF